MLAVLWFAGCKGLQTTQDIGFYNVKADRTRIFLFAPGHTSEGDVILTKGQELVVLRKEYGYSHVMTVDGQKGYVATNDIEPKPGRMTAGAGSERTGHQNLAPLPPRGSGAPNISSANRSVIQSGALFESNLPPLPQDPEIPRDDKSRPSFRVTVPPVSTPPADTKPKGRFRVNVPARNTPTADAKPKGE
jgi:hypothetical protein